MTRYYNYERKRTQHPIYAGMKFNADGTYEYGTTKRIGFKIIETVYDVNPLYPSDKAIVSEREMSRKLTA